MEPVFDRACCAVDPHGSAGVRYRGRSSVPTAVPQEAVCGVDPASGTVGSSSGPLTTTPDVPATAPRGVTFQPAGGFHRRQQIGAFRVPTRLSAALRCPHVASEVARLGGVWGEWSRVGGRCASARSRFGGTAPPWATSAGAANIFKAGRARSSCSSASPTGRCANRLMLSGCCTRVVSQLLCLSSILPSVASVAFRASMR